MNFKENLRFLRKQNHVSQEQLAEFLGYKSFTTIQKWEDGTSMPNMRIIQKIADYFQVSLQHFTQKALQEEAVSLIAVPVLGTVRGGPGIYAEQDIQDYEYITDKEAGSGEYFYLDVVGDSMKNARILEGDRVYIKAQDNVENGEIAVILLENNEATLKRVYYKKDIMILQPENEAYEPMVFSLKEAEEKNIRILGKLIHNKIRY